MFKLNRLQGHIRECRSFRNNIPQFCQSAKNHSAKKTFGNATIWQNNSAKNIRKLGIGNKLFRKRTIGNLPSAKVDNEIIVGHASYIVNCLYICLLVFLSSRTRFWIKEGISIHSISVSYFLGGVTNFRDRVDNWKKQNKSLSPSDNEALGSQLSF